MTQEGAGCCEFVGCEWRNGYRVWGRPLETAACGASSGRQGSLDFARNDGFQEYQIAITKAVQRYLNTLKEQGVDGPWFVGLSFLFVRGFEMIIGHWPIANAAVREGDPEHVQTDLVMIPADADTSNAEVVAGLLKAAYVQVWRAFHTSPPT